MSKTLIGALVGTVILFIWQFISWGIADLHYNQISHTSQQEAIIEALAEFNLEDGDYFIPRAAKGASDEEAQAMADKYIGKPWAIVKYRNVSAMDMGSNLIRGFAIDFIAIFLLVWVIGKMANPNFNTILLSSIAIGIIGYLTVAYLKSIWFDGNSIADLIDAIVPWGIIGAWLGWWLNR